MKNNETTMRLKNTSPHEITKQIGVIVKKYRKHAGLSQQQLSKLSGVAQSQISKLESGVTIEVGSITLTKIGCALDLHITPWWLE